MNYEGSCSSAVFCRRQYRSDLFVTAKGKKGSATITRYIRPWKEITKIKDTLSNKVYRICAILINKKTFQAIDYSRHAFSDVRSSVSRPFL